MIVGGDLRCSFVHFEPATGRTRCGELCAHFLNERFLLFQLRLESVDFVLLFLRLEILQLPLARSPSNLLDYVARKLAGRSVGPAWQEP